MNKLLDFRMPPLAIVKTLLSMILAVGCFKSVAAQEYTITKLKLFPDRDEVFIKDVTLDSLGFIWFLTNGEIYRYDGYRSLDVLETIADQRLTDDMPQRILIDRQHRLWMAGNANLNYLDLKTWEVTAVDSILLPPIHNRSVHWIKQLTDSTIMVAYENGHLLLIDGDRYRRIDELYEQSIRTDNKLLPRSATFWKGKYWVGTTAGLLLSVDPERDYETEYHRLPGINRMVMYMVAQAEALFLDVFEQGTYRLEASGELTEVAVPDLGLSSDSYYVLQEGERIHAYADHKWVRVLDPDLNVLQQLAIPSKHAFRTTSVRIDGNEAVLGTEEGIFAVYRKTPGLSQLIPTNAGANKSTRGIYIYPDGAIFYSTYNGAGFVGPHGDTTTFLELRHAYAVHPMNENELLIGTEGGFLKTFDRRHRRIADLDYTLSADAKRQHAFNLPLYVMCLAETANDYLIGSMNGLWTLGKQRRNLRRFEGLADTPGALDFQIRHIQFLPDSSLLLSTHIGLYEVNEGRLIKRYPQSGNLGVFKSVVVGDTIWVATQGNGLVAIDRDGRILQVLTTSEGLSNNLVYSLEHVGDFHVVGTANGLNIVSDSRVRRIGTAEGLSQSEFNSGASFWDASRKRVYIGGLMGYTVLDMTQPWFESRNQAESYVTEIHTSTGTAGEKLADYTWPYRGKRQLVLQPDQSLTGLYVGTPRNHRIDSEIRYALNNGEWEPLELGQFISLIAPSPGDYRFQLETQSTTVTGNKRTFTIIKLPYFYETWWFNVLVLVVMAGVIGGFFKYRENILRKEKKMRVKIASDLHDEVGSSLTRIYFQAGNLSAKRDGKTADKQLRQITDTSKQALLTMSDMVWSIDSRFDTVKDLVIRMKDYLYKLRDELEISHRFNVRGDQSVRAVSQLVRQNLFLIFKEALTNAIKYGDGSEISIELDFGRFTRLTVVNRCAKGNGPVTDRQGGRGLESMRQRAERMGGKLSYAADAGVFTLNLVVP